LTRTTPVGVLVPDPGETATLTVCAVPTGIVVLDAVIEVIDDKPVTVSGNPDAVVEAYVPSPE
jgi:hypothetical protein